MLTVAAKGQELVALPRPENISNQSSPSVKGPYCIWTITDVPVELWRTAHCSLLLSADTVFTVFGFACSDNMHKRVFSPMLTDMVTNVTKKVQIDSKEHTFDGRQHACAVRFVDGSILISGGRTSPLHACPYDILLSPCMEDASCMTAAFVEPNFKPKPRWRHTLNVVRSNGKEYAFLFGGRTPNEPVLDDCYLYCVITNTWAEIAHTEHTPSKRHSHSAVTVRNTKVFITCGLGKDEAPLNSIYAYDMECDKWHKVDISGVLRRYSHSAHFVQPNTLLLVGGVSRDHSKPCGVGVVDLASGQCREVAFPCQDPAWLQQVDG